MVNQVIEAIHRQQMALFMQQVLNQGGGFILALVDDDEEDDGSSTALAPYTGGGFLGKDTVLVDDT